MVTFGTLHFMCGFLPGKAHVHVPGAAWKYDLIMQRHAEGWEFELFGPDRCTHHWTPLTKEAHEL